MVHWVWLIVTALIGIIFTMVMFTIALGIILGNFTCAILKDGIKEVGYSA